MGVQTRQVNTCDACQGTIGNGQEYVDAMTYGATFHRTCWYSLLGPMLAKLLGLDDIKWRIEGEPGPDGGKVIYTNDPTFDVQAAAE